ncbi:MAG: hypothetical protein SFT94_02205 [Pseudanabaenaceae cyanobacterium bins.68]|nr:hypothetical protein [Pseudanabaenaceae cyanobacterium bins.68]
MRRVRAFQTGGVYSFDCEVGEDQIVCHGLVIDNPSLAGDLVCLVSVDDKTEQYIVRLPAGIDSEIGKYILQRETDYDRVPF